MRLRTIVILGLIISTLPVWSEGGNRLTYLDESNPYYPSHTFPKLITPQWIGETGVEAAVVLAIDDLRIESLNKYEEFLRPILERLKQIEGHAPVSIMTNTVEPGNSHLQKWLREGVNLETHSIAHPCPILAEDDFGKAAKTYHDCVDLLSQVKGNFPVAFRVPCCDSMNSPSPRFYNEIFNHTSAHGKFLSIDSSVFVALTPNDPELPREFVTTSNNDSRFLRYLKDDFVNYIYDYPYPYVMGKLCWQFPCITPSDYQAQVVNEPNNPRTVDDWKKAFDAVALKQGTFTMVFHPHGWIQSSQMVELIDYMDKEYGSKVKFLTFNDAQKRINKHLLQGYPLRTENGADNGVRLLDVNDDGYLDVVISNEHIQKTRVWSPENDAWIESGFPAPLVHVDANGSRRDSGVRFGILPPNRNASFILHNENTSGAWRFDGKEWIKQPYSLQGLQVQGKPVFTSQHNTCRGVRLRDLDGDGWSELLVSNPEQQAVFSWSASEKQWKQRKQSLPAGTLFVDAKGRDAGLRFVDLNADSHDDLVFSNEDSYSTHVYQPKEKSWRTIQSGKHSGVPAIPQIVRDGKNNGVWFHSNKMYIQNERYPKTDSRTFTELIGEK